MAAISYEIYGLKEGRWLLEAVEESEEPAIAHARSLFLVGGWEEVKVLRQRSLMGLVGMETEVFRQKKPTQKDKPVQITRIALKNENRCSDLDDFYTFEGRMIIGRLLRQHLEKFKITATELLHNYKYITKLNDAGNLVGSAIHHVARSQNSAAEGETAKHRAQALEKLVQQGIVKARDLVAEKKKLPKFQVAELAKTSAAIRQAVGNTRHAYVFLTLLTDYFYGGASLYGKMEQALDMMETLEKQEQETGNPEIAPLYPLLEGVITDVLASAEVVKELLGPQPTLGDGLGALGDFLNGRPPGAGTEVSPLLPRLGALIRSGRAGLCRVVLIERLRQGVAQDQPLDKREPLKDDVRLKSLVERLKDAQGQIIGGSVVERALAERGIRHRQALLRAQGMHDIADNLRQYYTAKPDPEKPDPEKPDPEKPGTEKPEMKDGGG